MKAIFKNVVVFVVLSAIAIALAMAITVSNQEMLIVLKKVAGEHAMLLLALCIAPAVEEMYKLIFLLRSKKMGFWAALLFSVYEFLSYIGMLVMGGQFTVVNAILYRIPALVMHPATVVFHINGKTRLRGWLRGVIAHTLFNVLALIAFTFEWWP